MVNQPKIGYAIGGGAAKAVVQYGILRKLHQEKIPLHYIMGSSMGAIIGAIFASGLPLEELEEKTFDFFSKRRITDLSNINIFNESLFKQTYIEKLLKDLFGDMHFEDCKIPFAVTAASLESGMLKVIDSGPLWEGVMVSTAIPGLFNPIFKNGNYLVDGGLLEDSPVAPLRKSGKCDLVVGSRIIDNNARQVISGLIYEKYYKKQSKNTFFKKTWDRLTIDTRLMFQIVYRAIAIVREELFTYKLKEAHPDLFMEIEMSDVEAFSFHNLDPVIARGEKVMEEQLPRLRELISKHQK